MKQILIITVVMVFLVGCSNSEHLTSREGHSQTAATETYTVDATHSAATRWHNRSNGLDTQRPLDMPSTTHTYCPMIRGAGNNVYFYFWRDA